MCARDPCQRSGMFEWHADDTFLSHTTWLCRLRAHSMKAGVCTPATHVDGTPWNDIAFNAQRRPEFALRRHQPPVLQCVVVSLRSTKAGVCTPATLDAGMLHVLHHATAQRRPEFALRRHARRSRRGRARAGTLNEGRSLHSGDTGHPRGHPREALQRSTKAGVCTPATHVGPGHVEVVRHVRSTKAGVCTPATLAAYGECPRGRRHAQRRPEFALRRHARSGPPNSSYFLPAQRRPEFALRRHPLRVAGVQRGGLGRSTKAGVCTPATPVLRDVLRQPDLARSTKAGVCTPATPRPYWAESLSWTIAQRRPEFALRRHVVRDAAFERDRDRSTKAGVCTPATPVTISSVPVLLRDAQRRPEFALRRHRRPHDRLRRRRGRSTKAGVCTPATPRRAPPASP